MDLKVVLVSAFLMCSGSEKVSFEISVFISALPIGQNLVCKMNRSATNLNSELLVHWAITHTHAHVHMHTHTHACTHMHTQAHAYTRMHTHTHMHTHVHSFSDNNVKGKRLYWTKKVDHAYLLCAIFLQHLTVLISAQHVLHAYFAQYLATIKYRWHRSLSYHHHL